MRYPCNLYGKPSSSWLFWSDTQPIRSNSQSPWSADARTRSSKTRAGVDWRPTSVQPRPRRAVIRS